MCLILLDFKKSVRMAFIPLIESGDSEHVCDLKRDSGKKKKGFWGVRISETIPYFGCFLQLKVTSRSPVDQIQFYVTTPSVHSGSNKSISKSLSLSLKDWPTVPPCVNCPLRERLFRKKFYEGFAVAANAYAYCHALNPYGSHNNVDSIKFFNEAKEISFRRVNIFIFWVDSSLYWVEEGSMVKSCIPSNTIKTVHNGLMVAPEMKIDSCFMLEAHNGFRLYLDLVSNKQCKLWLELLEIKLKS
ncbi:MAG: hypothetical protein Hyperionvirus2_35 [Hyperionvirus sp.]|uniref:Uncharacterized protein n=1 Tax=Hyperionvirus sp. TaxID=2487770 RepID=A0A3G5A610_9VIRU|nr:MAG: hypothetical protein Hyperionvirus2_35 [Hyperionvirus sp.]